MIKITRDQLKTTVVAAALVLGILAVYHQVRAFDFLNYDDNVYITENPYVMNGVTRDGVIAAFTQPINAGWTPVSTLTQMIDVDLFGLDPGPPHVINVIFHCSNTVLLFMLLHAMTGVFWPSAFAAALFALHPLHVEPVAWLSSRKDVLSMHFFLLTLKFYMQYAERGTWKPYLLSFFHFLPALLCKPMVVTLPVLLLLLDAWPLRRLAASPVFSEKRRIFRGLFREKIPFLLASLAACIITVYVQSRGGAVRTLTEVGFLERLGNAMISYVMYVWVTVWPAGLAPYYPYPAAISLWAVLAAVAGLIAVTAFAVSRWHKSPYLFTGWFWWLVTLLPVIGIVQIGSFARADRFTYLPHIGLFIMVAWGIDELTRKLPARRVILSSGAVAVLTPLLTVSYVQAGYWKDTITLFEHTLRVTPDNAVAHNNLGVALMKRARAAQDGEADYASAESHLREAVRIVPAYADAHNNLGIALMLQGKDGSLEAFQKTLELAPDSPDALINVANARLAGGSVDEAILLYQRAASLSPANVEAHYNLGVALSQKGDVQSAVSEYKTAAKLKPGDATLHVGLANALLLLNQLAEAQAEATEAVRLDPKSASAQYYLGIACHLLGQAGPAEKALQAALDLDPNYVDAHQNLAAILANQGRVEEAIHHFSEAMRLDPANAAASEALSVLRGDASPAPAEPPAASSP
ncbi:MAG: tetratricopeptide repeat protein [Candidatus Hydrogenedentes bacterium]|nr:tetratricopeptide repeat protein [Candidatus Hydrogenedentota bacterium]